MTGPGKARGGPVTLVGLRGAGKTAVGRALARALGGAFVDLDEALAARAAVELGRDDRPGAGQVLAQVGIEAFRDLEERCLAEALARTPSPGTGAALAPAVLATGGGAIERASNRERLARTRCVWLDAPVEVLAARVRSDPTFRPPLLGAADPADELAEFARRRAPLYAAVAGLRLDAGSRTVDQLVAAVLDWLAGAEIPRNP